MRYARFFLTWSLYGDSVIRGQSETFALLLNSSTRALKNMDTANLLGVFCIEQFAGRNKQLELTPWR